MAAHHRGGGAGEPGQQLPAPNQQMNAQAGGGGGWVDQGFNPGYNPGYGGGYGGGDRWRQPPRGRGGAGRGRDGGGHRGEFLGQAAGSNRHNLVYQRAGGQGGFGPNNQILGNRGSSGDDTIVPPSNFRELHRQVHKVHHHQQFAGSSATKGGMHSSAENLHNFQSDVDKVSKGETGLEIQGASQGKNKPYCYKCLTEGHKITECTTVLSCDMCGSDEHVTKACASSKHTKPTALPCGYAVEGLGFYYIPYLGDQLSPSDSVAAMVRVIEGTMSVENVIAELQRLVPCNWEWKVDENGENTFVTTFPSKADLLRLVEWGPVVTKSVKATMVIEERAGLDVYRCEIPKVWLSKRAPKISNYLGRWLDSWNISFCGHEIY
ncbi:hypothetical protein BS78_07G089300 [Paspalum vaginatum]|uniref:CCHC-type domain-containing protein n=1 Tax=Paspalum vaginatum TaxID=158149 RepID=A0A9W7X983_9POAL|nr:hypothetical protein BS78_K171700 [Paspalum vaginatum]KAJ1267844.1 hypothetical protein BS78_07G089300 [Paspalum vaginatum]